MESALVATPESPAALLRRPSSPLAAYLGSLAVSGRRGIVTSLDRAASILTTGIVTDATGFPWETVRYEHLSFLKSELTRTGAAPSTACHVISAVKGVCREAWHMGVLDDGAWLRISAVKGVKGSRLPAGRALSGDELARLFRACPATANGVRDAAMLGILFGAGLRRSEVVNLDLSDLNQQTGELIVRAGKGNKDRTVWLANGALRATRSWLLVRGDAAGPLLLPIVAGRPVNRRLTDNAILMVLARMAKRARVVGFSPHDLRRSMITALEAAGVALTVTQQIAGHSSVQTTAKYSRAAEAAKRQAAEALVIPYLGAGE